jgi:hypothetical protein
MRIVGKAVKVLYLSGAKGPDYLCDVIFSGLRALLGPDVVDVNRLDYMYHRVGEAWTAFTLYNLLDPEPEPDRSDIESKIRNRYFDVILYGSVLRDRPFLPLVLDTYDHKRVGFIDGEDEIDTSYIGFERIPEQNLHDWEPRTGHVVPRDCPYFKRELTDPSRAIPISFGIPREKISSAIPAKIRLMALCDPRDRSTYVYSMENQAEYYKQYGESYFGFTRRQGGWDCMRHYEILAAGAVPYFENIDSCPEGTLTFWPKDTLRDALLLHDYWTGSQQNLDDYAKILARLRFALTNYLTTDALAKYVLERMTR